MNRALLTIICFLAQANRPLFEAADLHLSPEGTTESEAFLVGARVEIRSASLPRIMSMAYSVPEDQIEGIPSWVDELRFDITAKGAPGASELGMRNMLQTLLEERLDLKIRREDKPRPVFAFVTAKSGVAKESKGSGDPGCKASFEEGYRVIDCYKTSIGNLGEALHGMAGGYFNLPVVDKTGLKGLYDVKLRFLARGQLAPGPEGASASLFNVIEKELGIKVEKQTAPLPVLSIVSVNREPAPNPPGVTEKLGPAPTEFDVAEIKPSAPETKEDFNLNNGRIEARAVPLKDLIEFAFNAEDSNRVRGEKWIESARFDIVAKTAPTESPDTLRVMLRNLLAQRFELKVHTEQQPVNVYALTAQKPKLKQADGSQRSQCRVSVADGARVFTCQNTTMAQLAEKMQQAAGGSVDHQVVDLTGLKGSYDFDISFVPFARMRRIAEKPKTEGAGLTDIEPPSGLTVFDAIERQMGIRLAAQKYPRPVVVVDHCSRTPAEN